jgi:GMP synthase (glutamine-hydrolysing)
MRPVILIGHDANETFGVAPRALADAGRMVRTHRGPDGDLLPSLDEIAGIVLFGGAMNIDATDRHPFLADERAYVRDAVAAGVPYLGICLGAQMLARALDRSVHPAGIREFGFQTLHLTPDAARDPLLPVFEDGDAVFHWHEDTFELPHDAVLLGTGDDVPLQAFRVGDRAWGLQFHLEIDRPELERWLEAAGEDVVRSWGMPSAEVLTQADRFLPTQERKARELFRRFADVLTVA